MYTPQAEKSTIIPVNNQSSPVQDYYLDNNKNVMLTLIIIFSCVVVGTAIPLWVIKDIPFVWGPIGGMELMPTAYLEGTPLKVRLKVILKNIINDYQRKHQPRVVAAIKRADALIAATKGAYDLIHDYHHKDVVLINETGCYYNPEIEDTNHSDFNILWVGKFDFRKQLGLALKIISQLPDDVKVKLHIAGTGNEKVMAQYKKLSTELNIADNVIWHGQVSHEEVQELMKQSQVFLFTSIMEETPHVVLEALQNNLPVICFNTCGQEGVVNKSIGVKIPLSNPEQSVKDFCDSITHLFRHPEKLADMKKNCQKRQLQLTWDGKIRQIEEIYAKSTTPQLKNEKVFNLIWVGRFVFSKRLDIALKALAATGNSNYILHILGSGTEREIDQYKTLAEDLKISRQCRWYGNVPHEKVLELMRESDLFFFTSIYESTSTVVLEAISSGLPVLSFNTCGFGPLVKEFAGVAVKLTTTKQSVNDFAKEINYLSSHREVLEKYSQEELDRRRSLSWKSKAEDVVGIYKKISTRSMSRY